MAAGLLTRQQAKRFVERCFDSDFRMVRQGSMYGTSWAVQGLLRYGYKRETLRLLKAVYRPMLKRGITFWEDLSGEKSLVHGVMGFPVYLYWKYVTEKEVK